ncbi:MAG: SRPBCC family protein [Acidimicrobiia bacterium]|nr:SRPBCC family protein [Acidimicrobiia bacterium]
MPSSYRVERSTSVSASPSDVFTHLADYRNWGAWSPWDELDPNMTKTYTGEAGEVGSGYHWVGNRKVGEGRMTTSAISEPNNLEIDLQFIKPFKSQSTTMFTVEPQDDGSSVTWSMTGEHTLMSRVMGIFKSMDSMVGPDFEKGLARLKRVCEAD